MSTGPLKVAGFVGLLAAVFGVAMAVGDTVAPVARATPEKHADRHADEHANGDAHEAALPGGLMVSESGYTLEAPPRASAGADVPLDFTINGPDGHPVTGYDVQHEKQLHLIAVRRDFAGFQHVHPTLDADGRWHTRLDLTAGQWRVFADFKPTGGPALTLGSDLLVPGRVEPEPIRGVVTRSEVDGYRVDLAGALTPGAASPLRLTVTRDGRPVEVQPYLGASGHLVVLREGDLAYLHVHPERPDELSFVASVPSAGRYHLFLDFKVDGVVRTASFVLTAEEGHDDGH